MLPSAHRMRRASDFTLTTRRGTKVSRGRVVCYVHTVEDSEPVQVGLIVGKVVGNSVQRHRAARRLRACLTDALSQLPPGTRVVVRALSGADIDPELCVDVETCVAAALQRARGAAS